MSIETKTIQSIINMYDRYANLKIIKTTPIVDADSYDQINPFIHVNDTIPKCLAIYLAN